MNPNTNRLEPLTEEQREQADKLKKALAYADQTRTDRLLRHDGTPVPEHWSIFKVGDHVVVNNYTFEVAHIGESHLLLEPVGPVVIGGDT